MQQQNPRKNISRGDKVRRKYKYVDRSFILFLLTSFQVISFTPVIFGGDKINYSVAIYLLAYILFEWLYVGFMRVVPKKVNFELEFIAFFLSGIGLCLQASVAPAGLLKQLITVIAGVIVYDILLWFIMPDCAAYVWEGGRKGTWQSYIT